MMPFFSIHSLGGYSSATETGDPTVVTGRAADMATGLGAASLATVAPDPAVVNVGEETSADTLGQLNSSMSQWGSTIASISAAATPTTSSPSTVNIALPVGAAVQAQKPSSNQMLVIVGIVAVLILFLTMEE